MRFYILAAFLLPIFGNANELKIPPQGKQEFKNEFRVIRKNRYEVVRALTEDGKKKLDQLHSEGYSCSYKGQSTYLCSNAQSVAGTENEIKESVFHKMESYSQIEFAELRGEPYLVSKGDALEIWEIPQAVTFAGKVYDSYRYFIGANTAKIFLGEPAEQTLNIAGDGSLIYPLLISKTESKNIYYSYFVGSFFRM